MRNILDKIFSPLSLILLNIGIIFAAEFAGGGLFFYETGLIHAVAILFIILAASRFFYHTYTYDPIFEKLVHATIAASVVFAISHIFEFASMMIFHSYKDATFANVVNFYLIGFILIAIGAESFLRIIDRRSTYIIKLFSITILAFAVLIVLFSINDKLISLEPDSFAPILYAFLIGIISIIGIGIVGKIKKLVPISAGFSNYLISSLVLIIFAMIPYVFYEFIAEKFYYYNIQNYQIIYVGHFAFFAALSFLFLAFTKLSWGGVYAETRNLVENKKI